jgi:hypothetical protein
MIIRIGARYVRQEKDGLRPFQREALEAIKNSDARLTFVEVLFENLGVMNAASVKNHWYR